MDAPPTADRKPCCICDEPGGKHCTKCKSRHYCSKKCQLVDWKEGGHNKACKQMAADFQDRLLDELMPAKLKIKEAPAIVEDVAPAAGSTAAAGLPAARTTALVKANVVNDTPSWRGTCAVCLDLLPLGGQTQGFFECCCKRVCKECYIKCREYDTRCPLCRAPASTSNTEWVRRVQKHVDKGNAEAQHMLGNAYLQGFMGLKQNKKLAAQLLGLAVAQGHAEAQAKLGRCYYNGDGVKVDFTTAARWDQRAAEQGYPEAQFNLAMQFYRGHGVAQSYEEAVRWWRLAAAQGNGEALCNLGVCYEFGLGVPQDLHEALRCYKRTMAQGYTEAAAKVAGVEATLAASRAR